MDAFFVIEAGTRHVHVLGVASCPDGAWTVQQTRDLLMDFGKRAAGFRFLVRDRVGQCTEAFGAMLPAAGIEGVKTRRAALRANSYAELFAGTLRHECLDHVMGWVVGTGLIIGGSASNGFQTCGMGGVGRGGDVYPAAPCGSLTWPHDFCLQLSRCVTAPEGIPTAGLDQSARI